MLYSFWCYNNHLCVLSFGLFVKSFEKGLEYINDNKYRGGGINIVYNE